MTEYVWANVVVLIISMLVLHVIADFHLQGCLADLKQKRWWMDNVFSKGFNHKYDKDYLAALAMHGLEWSIIVHIPVFWLAWTHLPDTSTRYLILLASVLIQAVLHAVIDDLKCNRYKLNLIQDQMLHIGQLILIYLTLILAHF